MFFDLTMNNSKKIYLCFTTTDSEKEAMEIYEDRVKNNLWPIYHRTNQFRKVLKDVKVIFYLAGNGSSSQHFIGTATIEKIIEKFEDLNVNTSNVKFFVKFKDIKKFENFIFIKDVLNELDFINIKEKYGLTFQGGVTEVDEKSYELIVKKDKN